MAIREESEVEGATWTEDSERGGQLPHLMDTYRQTDTPGLLGHGYRKTTTRDSWCPAFFVGHSVVSAERVLFRRYTHEHMCCDL